MDELSAVQRLLAEPPPGPDVMEAARLRLEHAALGGTPPHTRAAGRGWRAPGRVRRAAGPRRWSGWLVPVAAAAAAAGVIIASLAVSGVILRRAAGTGPANSSGVFAKVPRYFVALRGDAVVGVTATGAVRGTVAPPKPNTVFTLVAAAGDDRTFVLAAERRRCPCPVTYYRLVLSRSGRPDRLAPLPIPAETPAISSLALSPDGSKLAVSVPPVPGHRGSRIQVFSLATGARREWVWPAQGTIGENLPVGGTPNLWEADNRTLLFEVATRTKAGLQWQLRLLDTAAPAGSLLASSTRIPIHGAGVGWQHNSATRTIIGIPLITGDGTKLVALVYHQAAPRTAAAPPTAAATPTAAASRTAEAPPAAEA